MATVEFAEVRTPRPSCREELCCVLDSTDEGCEDIVTDACETGAEVTAKLDAGSTHIVGTPDAFQEFIESPDAARLGFIWLT